MYLKCIQHACVNTHGMRLTDSLPAKEHTRYEQTNEREQKIMGNEKEIKNNTEIVLDLCNWEG